MISQAAVATVIDPAGEVFRECWETLGELRPRRTRAPDLQKRVISFQYTLAEALFKVDEMRQTVRAEVRDRIKRKTTFDPVWFRNRMRRLDEYEKALAEAVKIGREIGDVFAWGFYAKDHDLLHRHFAKPSQPHTPPGLGGAGELQFIRHFPKLGEHLILYHGITSFLRLGDVSLVTLEGEMRVAAIGELKTTPRPEDEELELSLLIYGPDFAPPAQSSKAADRKVKAKPLPARVREKLKKQMNEIERAFPRVEPDAEHSVFDETHIAVLNELADDLESKQISIKRATKSLLLGALRFPPEASLAKRLMPGRAGTRLGSRFGDELAAAGRELVNDQDSAHNALRPGYLTLDLMPGVPPWPFRGVRESLVEMMLFRDVLVVACHAPSALYQGFRELGLEVEGEPGGRRVRLRRHLKNGRTITIDERPLLALVQFQLFSERMILRLVRQTLDDFESGRLEHLDALDLRLQMSLVERAEWEAQ